MTRGSAASAVGRVAGLSAIALLQTYWFLQPVPLPLKGLAALLVAVSIARPAAGLLVFAGLAPLSTVIASLCGGAGMGAQLLEQMALGVGAGVLARAGPPDGRTRIGAPALFMAVVAVASAAAMIPAAAAPIARGISGAGLLLQELAVRQTAPASPVWAPLFAALVIAECGLLGWAVERTVRRAPQLATRLVLIALAGHAGAAVLNFQAVLGWALRTGDGLEALPRLLTTARVSLQTDWNAGASALLLAGVAGFGLTNGSRARRAAVGLLLALIAFGVWLTGSHIALAMGIAAGVAAVGWWGAHAGWRKRLVVTGVAVLILGVGAWVVVTSLSGRNDSISRSATLRGVMAKAGVQMFEEAPVFGIGVTRFYDASAAFAGPYLRSVGWRPRENAHNNFIQVLAEQGLVGLAALLWWLAAVLVSGTRAQIAKPDPVRGGLLLAIVACVGTWLTGHPLLVPEFAFVFWLYCGIVAAMTPAVPLSRPRWLLWVLVAAVLVSVPPRAYALRNVADLEHLGLGLSLWQHDDTQRYREAGTSFALFLPASGRPVEVPIRRAPGAPDPLVVDVSVRDRLVDRISIEGEAWQMVVVVVRPGSRRFESVDFIVHPPASGADLPRVLLRVGKTAER